MNQENNITVTVWAEVIEIDCSGNLSDPIENVAITTIAETDQFNISFFGSLGKHLQGTLIDDMISNLTKDCAVILDTGVTVDIRKTSDISDYELDPRIASALGLYYA